MQTGFRPDIQGLRALAVLVVIVFHAGLPLSGGFVGVDVFFVISGYVITAMLMREWDRTGSISLGSFYLRRAKRLTPALALVVAVTAVVSSLFLSPFDQQEQAAQTGLGALALVANWVIAAQTGDYFGAAADSNPLLHTWSLSVEEQFYLVFPIALLVAWRFGRRLGSPNVAALLLVGFLGVASLAMLRGAALGVPSDSWVLGYYSPFNRAWEFAAGAALAVVAQHLPRSKSLATGAGAAGLLLVAVSVTMIDAQTPFPGKWTLVPVAGTALCIAAGCLHERNLVSRALALRPAVKVGDWSYALYLWHWPLIVTATALFPLSPLAAPVAAILCVMPAVASYAWVETPFRRMNSRPARPVVLAVVVVVAVSTAFATTTWVVAGRVWTPAYASGSVWIAHPDADEVPDAEAGPANTGVPCQWDELSAYIGDNGLCRQVHANETPDVVLLGDSHAEHLFPGLAEALPDREVGVVSFRAPYMFGTEAGLDLALDSILGDDPPSTVLVSRKWVAGQTAAADQDAPLAHAVQRLADEGVDVRLVDDVPAFPYPVSTCSDRLAPVIAMSICDQPRERVDDLRDAYLAGLRRVAAAFPGTKVVEIGTTLCNDSTCTMLSGGEVAYSDPDHLNLVGSRVFATRLVQAGDLHSVPSSPN